MSSSVTAVTGFNLRKCSFCAEEVLADAKKCKHCGEFIRRKISTLVLLLFAVGIVIACVLAGTQPAPSEGILAVGVWSIFTVLFARMFVSH